MFGTRPVVAITGVAYALLGLALGAGGAWLVSLGGSPYYLIAGTALLLTGLLLLAGSRWALWLYAALVLGTLGWAVSEIGLDWWAMVPRGDVIAPLGVWLLMPWIIRPLRPGPRGGAIVLALALLATAVVGAVAATSDWRDIAGTLPEAGTATRVADNGAPMPDADWRAYGRTGFGNRFSPLKQITPQNVAQLQVAWTFRTGDTQQSQDPTETTFEVTPLKVGNTVYLCSQHQVLFALDAATGAERWKFDPQVKQNPTFQHLTCRGVSYHETAAGVAGAECARRVFLPTNDARMIALDADTGALCQGFADHGVLNLNEGMGVTTAGFWEATSPPVVTANMLIVGGSVIDNYSTEEPSGVIRGFDVQTGKLVWAWDAGSAEENELPSEAHPYSNNSPNSWIVSAADEKLGLVYVPMGVHTPDIWGGNRPELAERYASAIVALDIATGKRVWAYQTVHHDLWDMDVPAQPTLVDLPTDGGVVPALLAPTKTGNLFVLDRRTGAPIVPAPERPVPQGPAPGEHLSPTQPFSDLTFRPEAKLSGADMWGSTLFDQLACRIMFHRLRYEGTFTPPSLQGTLVFPGNLGMFEWGGIAVDPVRQIAIANPIAIPFVSRLIPRGPDNPTAPNGAHPPGSEVGVQPMYGTPFGVDLHAFLSPVGLPCKMPPWGYVAGIDLRAHKIAWMHRNGTIRDSSPVPLPFKLGVPSLGGPLVTAGGVAFLTSTLDYFIRGYDVTTGQQLWEQRLPAGGQSTPMSYEQDGRQFIVTADGGHGSFGTKRGDYVIAYALPAGH